MKILKESYENNNSISVEDLKYIRNKLDDLIYELEENIGITDTGFLDNNNSGLSMPYIVTESGFISIDDIYRYIPDIYKTEE